MRRRTFILLAASAAMIRPLAVNAQQGERMRRVGMLLPANQNDAEYPTLVGAFTQALQHAGWSEGRNVQFNIHWGGGNADGITKEAAALVANPPNVVLAAGSAAAGPLLHTTHTIPVVFTIVPDPVGAGLVDSLAHPGGNATGFASFEYDIGGKWLELLKELTPSVKRVAVARDPGITAGIGQFEAIQSVARSAGVEANPINLHDEAGITREVGAFARDGNAGLIVTSSGLSVRYRDLLVRLAAANKLPAVYYARSFVDAGGLLSYGVNRADQFASAAAYVDRILKGEKPADLPVQTPTRYELVINRKTANALGISLPPSLLASADEVIE